MRPWRKLGDNPLAKRGKLVTQRIYLAHQRREIIHGYWSELECQSSIGCYFDPMKLASSPIFHPWIVDNAIPLPGHAVCLRGEAV